MFAGRTLSPQFLNKNPKIYKLGKLIRIMSLTNDQWIKQEVKEITFLILFGIVMAILLPYLFFGLGTGAFEESFVQDRALLFSDILVGYIIYYVLIMAALIGLPILKVREMYVTDRGEHPATQSKPDAFSVAYIHDPSTDGLLYNLFDSIGMKNAMAWSLSMFRVMIISSLVFGAIGILQMSTQFSFVGVPQIQHQITPAAEVFFGAEPPAFSETITMILIFSLLMGFNAWFSSKLKLGKLGYFGIALLICILMGFGWMGIHSIVYGNSEAALMATFVFGSMGSLMTLLSGSWIPWWNWHFFNNLFFKLNDVATIKEDVMFIAIIIWTFALTLYIGGEIWWRSLKKKRTLPNVPS
jgi:hypothetical protein